MLFVSVVLHICHWMLWLYYNLNSSSTDYFRTHHTLNSVIKNENASDWYCYSAIQWRRCVVPQTKTCIRLHVMAFKTERKGQKRSSRKTYQEHWVPVDCAMCYAATKLRWRAWSIAGIWMSQENQWRAGQVWFEWVPHRRNRHRECSWCSRYLVVRGEPRSLHNYICV